MTAAAAASALAPKLVPPTTLLGGFLGTGKTTALSNLLKNRDGLKIAVLVNDVASVNVDAQILRRSTVDESGVEMVELENGCVCCGPGAGGLAPAMQELMTRVDESTGDAAFDHVVVELSGVADPTNVQRNLNGDGVAVDRKVALVDANAFPALYNSVAEMGDRIDLAGVDPMMIDPCEIDRRVVELLLVQIETADVILVNKVDLATDDELKTTLSACKALNERATIHSTTFGDAQLNQVLPIATAAAAVAEEGSCTEPACADPSCADPSCSSHDKEPEPAGSCTEPACADPSCADPDCSSHDKEPELEGSCTEPACADPSCADPACSSNEKEEPPAPKAPNTVESLGFETFIYRARRPFVQQRLVELVKTWPLPAKEILTLGDMASPGGETLDKMRELGKEGPAYAETFSNVLRSKGTCWLDQQHRVMAAWSHAGRHFRLTPEGSWWATLPDPIVRACLSANGEDTAADTQAYRAERANFVGEWGDRRQELVFIGVGLDEGKIQSALDNCLASDDEMMEYAAIWQVDEERLKATNGEAEPFRFDVGQRVECCMDEDDWEVGTILKKHYREPKWPTDRWMPYQVKLDEGSTIWAPADVEECIRVARE